MADDEIYSNLNSKQLGTVTNADLNTVSRAIHLEKANATTLNNLRLIKQVTGHASGPVPSSMKIISTVASVSEAYVEVITPEIDETWQLQSAHWTRSGGSGSHVMQMFYYDGSTRSGFLYFSSSSTDVILTSDDNWPQYPLYSDSNCPVVIQVTAGDIGTCTIQSVWVRTAGG